MWDLSPGFGAFPILTQRRLTHFDLPHTPFMPDSRTRPLNRRMLEIPQYKEEYLSYICQYLYSDLNPNYLFSKVDSLTNRIRESIYNEPEGNREFTTEEFEGNIEWMTVSEELRTSIPGLKEFITIRRQNVQEQLCDLGFSCVSNRFMGKSDDWLHVYPNPANQNITIELFTPDVLAEAIDVRIVNALGKVVANEKLPIENQQAILRYDIIKLPQGVYYIQLPEQVCNRSTSTFVVVH